MVPPGHTHGASVDEWYYIVVSYSSRCGAVLLFVRIVSAAGAASCDVDGVLLCKVIGRAQALTLLLLCWRCYGRPMVDGTSIVAGRCSHVWVAAAVVSRFFYFIFMDD